MISKIKEKQFFIPRILFMLVTIFMVFDGIRSNLLFGGVLSIIRDLSLILLLHIHLLLKRRGLSLVENLCYGHFLYIMFLYV